MTEKCKAKEPYYSVAEAEAARDNLKRAAKRSGKGGRSFHRLVVYRCGNHFHIGRDCTQRIEKMAALAHVAPVNKIPSYGQLMRRLRHIDERLLKEQRHRAYVLGQIIAADARRDYEAAYAAIFGSKPE